MFSFLAQLNFVLHLWAPLSALVREQTPISFYFSPVLSTLQTVFIQVTTLNALITFNFCFNKGNVKGNDK